MKSSKISHHSGRKVTLFIEFYLQKQKEVRNLFDIDLTEPHTLLEAQALRRRIRANHEKIPEIEEKLRKLSSGFQGEKTLYYYLGLIPEKKYHIFHGLRLPIGKSYFQIDFLLLSAKLILILDAKNNSGTLTIEKLQMTQEYLETKEHYQNPVSQVNRHRILLKYFFEKYQIPNIPIENLVVITKPSTKVVIAAGYIEAEKKVFRAPDVLKRIQEVEKYHTKNVIDPKAIGKIRKLFLSKHTPLKGELKKTLGIKDSDILSGVQCHDCSYTPMTFKRQKWVCPKCRCVSEDAHLQAIKDYFLLIKPWITNPELREFLHLPSSRSATYLLFLSNLPYTGINRARIYHPP
jgi:hypothetical protein